MNDDAKHMYVHQFQYTDVNALNNCSLTNALLHVLIRACVCVCVHICLCVRMCGLYVYITCACDSVCVSECTLIAHLYPEYAYTMQIF
jgi:hypothetical protein